jgi:hypothetical protein
MGRQVSKRFFFEKKNQKTFGHLAPACSTSTVHIIDVFFAAVLSAKKQTPAFYE